MPPSVMDVMLGFAAVNAIALLAARKAG